MNRTNYTRRGSSKLKQKIPGPTVPPPGPTSPARSPDIRDGGIQDISDDSSDDQDSVQLRNRVDCQPVSKSATQNIKDGLARYEKNDDLFSFAGSGQRSRYGEYLDKEEVRSESALTYRSDLSMPAMTKSFSDNRYRSSSLATTSWAPAQYDASSDHSVYCVSCRPRSHTLGVDRAASLPGHLEFNQPNQNRVYTMPLYSGLAVVPPQVIKTPFPTHGRPTSHQLLPQRYSANPRSSPVQMVGSRPVRWNVPARIRQPRAQQQPHSQFHSSPRRERGNSNLFHLL